MASCIAFLPQSSTTVPPPEAKRSMNWRTISVHSFTTHSGASRFGLDATLSAIILF